MSCGANLIDMGVKDQSCDLKLHAEMELLKQSLQEKQNQLTNMETQCLRQSGELEDSIVAWQDKYERLYESHKRVQKVNEGLEDKLLILVDNNTAERSQWTSDVAKLSVSLADANYLISNLRREIERYKTDMNLAIQLLRCNSGGFPSAKITTLPKDVQTKLTAIARLDSDSECTSNEGRRNSFQPHSPLDNDNNGMYRVLPASESPPPGVCPFPPTAMVHSMRGVDAKLDASQITPELMARYLEDEILAGDRFAIKTTQHCSTCRCKDSSAAMTGLTAPFHQHAYTIGTQTMVSSESNNSLCLRCNSNLNSPSRSSPSLVRHGHKVVRNGVKDDEQGGEDNLGRRKEELQVNPILGHPRRNADRIITTKANEGSLVSNGQAKGSEQDTDPGSFNNVLIKNIKMSQHMGKSLNRPRLCSMRISSEGAATTNIILENADASSLNCDTVSIVSQQQNTLDQMSSIKQVYKKRFKYLDEELDDSKEVIVCSDKRPHDSPGNQSKVLIELQNNNHLGQASCVPPMRPSCGESVAVVKEGDPSALLMDDPVPAVDNLQVMSANSSSLRQQQLQRVAVWVQQSNNQQKQLLISDSSRKCNDHSELSGSQVSQLTTVSPVSYSGDVCIDMGDDGEEHQEEAGKDEHAKINRRAEEDEEHRGQVVLAEKEKISQMEYNVKQFLLKQNEWSIGGGALPGGGEVAGAVNGTAALGNTYSPMSSSMSFASMPTSSGYNHHPSNLRTETNL